MSDTKPSSPSGGGCVLALGLVLLGLGAVLALAWVTAGLSPWSAALAAGLILLASGLLVLHAHRGLGQRLLAAGTVLVLAPWLLRVALVRGSDQARLTTLPGDSGPRLINRLYPEPDGALAMARLLLATSGLRDVEAHRLDEILRAAYERTTPAAAMQPTPAIATYLGRQSPAAFDTIVIRPPEQRVAPDGAVVFLHGYAGNFYVYCWEMAQAAAAANLLTLCPSSGPDGAWWEQRGADTLQATLDHAYQIGMNRVYLAGLSNGAAGASVLAASFRRRLAGVVLVSGLRAEVPPPLPVLVVHGKRDEMMAASAARAYAARGANVKYHELPGGHFIFLSDVRVVRPIIAEFLSALEKTATALPRR